MRLLREGGFAFLRSGVMDTEPFEDFLTEGSVVKGRVVEGRAPQKFQV